MRTHESYKDCDFDDRRTCATCSEETITALSARVMRSQETLAKYGTHDSDCTFRFGMNPELFPCTCGLSRALENGDNE